MFKCWYPGVLCFKNVVSIILFNWIFWRPLLSVKSLKKNWEQIVFLTHVDYTRSLSEY